MEFTSFKQHFWLEISENYGAGKIRKYIEHMMFK